MLHAQMSRRLKLRACRRDRAQRGDRDKCRRCHWWNGQLSHSATYDCGLRWRGICIARDDRKASRSRTFRMASLQENRTVLTYLHPVFFQRDLHCRPNDQKKHLRWREHSMCGFGSNGEIMAADLHRADAQPAPEVLEEWARSGAIGLALSLTDSDSLAESLEAALQLGLHLEVSGGLEGRERLAELLQADGHRLVFRGFGLADSARDPSWDSRLARLLALAQGAEVWVKRRESDGSQIAGPRQLRQRYWRSSGRNSCSGARSGRTSQPPTPTRHPTRRRLSGLRTSSRTRTPEGESSARRLRPFTDFGELRPGHLPK